MSGGARNANVRNNIRQSGVRRMKHSEIVATAGVVSLSEFDPPALPPQHARVRTLYSAISAGTELGMMAASRDKGIAVRTGYQACGVVEEVSFADDPASPPPVEPGDIVACYGAPHVHHASVLHVPRNLLARLPAGVEPMHAAFCGLGTIAMHAFRVAGLSLGETAAMVGLGALGNLTAQLCRAAGCRVAALEMLGPRRDTAHACGLPAAADMDALRAAVAAHSGGRGADVVFLAVGNASGQLLEDAVNMLCLRGRVVIIGTGNAPLPREPMFAKEASIVVSRAGGPGRYDPSYEAGGVDYPYGLVRWTEGRNLAEFVRLLGNGAVTVEPLISDVLPPSDAARAYEMLTHEPEKHVGVVFRWGDA